MSIHFTKEEFREKTVEYFSRIEPLMKSFENKKLSAEEQAKLDEIKKRATQNSAFRAKQSEDAIKAMKDKKKAAADAKKKAAAANKATQQKVVTKNVKQIKNTHDKKR